MKTKIPNFLFGIIWLNLILKIKYQRHVSDEDIFLSVGCALSVANFYMLLLLLLLLLLFCRMRLPPPKNPADWDAIDDQMPNKKLAIRREATVLHNGQR